MTLQEKLRQSTEQMNAGGGASHQDWELFLMTSIADSLAVIADCLTVITKEEMKDGNDDSCTKRIQ